MLYFLDFFYLHALVCMKCHKLLLHQINAPFYKMKFKIIVKKNINMTKIKINIKNKAFFQVTRIRRHGKLNFGPLIFFAYLIPVILRFYVLILNFIFIMLQSLRVQRREREIPEKTKKRESILSST